MSANDPQSEPMTVQQALNAAIEHHQAGSLAEAEAIYRQVLARQPDNTDALHLLGMIAHQMGKNQDAQELITRAININPITAVYYNNLGNVFTALGKTNESLHAYRTAIEFEPNYADAHNNLGGSLQTLGKFEDAVGAYRTALQLQPDSAHIYNNLGHALANGGQLDAAINAYRRAIKLKPDFADAYDNLGIALANSGQLDAAIEAYRAALRYKPDKHQIHSGLIHTMYFHPGFDDRAIHEEFVLWNQQHVEPLSKFIQPHTNPDSHRDDPERRLKIGYVSPDFRQHVVGWNLFPLLREHDRKDFEIICYSGVLRPDDMTDRIRVCANGWRSIVNITDEQVAQMIRDDQIDILVDLTMHMANNRLLVFARKPAPVQVTFMAYPGSTGLEAIDYRLSDPYLDPPETDMGVYSEQTVRLPDCFWCYDPLSKEPSINELPALKNGYITFGCLNSFIKVNDGVLDLWVKVLAAVPNSRLLVLAPEGRSRDHVLSAHRQNSIVETRLEFVDRQPRAQYLKLHQQIDCVLDTFPYNGHTTTLDALWMGVPVITLVGKTAMGRAGKSILTNIGLPEFIAQTPEEYIQIAVKLAGDLPRLAELRKTLRQRMENSPLMDAKSFAHDIESAYRDMWQKWCAEK